MNEQFVRELTANQSRLLAYVLTLLPDYEAAQDVVQNTNVVLWRKADAFREGTKFMTWACEVARLEVLAYFRDRGRDRQTFMDGELLDQLADDAQRRSEAVGDLGALLEECLNLQSEPERKLLRDRYSQGASVQKIAKDLGVTPNRLSVRLCRLRHSLLNCVERKMASAQDSPPPGESP